MRWYRPSSSKAVTILTKQKYKERTLYVSGDSFNFIPYSRWSFNFLDHNKSHRKLWHEVILLKRNAWYYPLRRGLKCLAWPFSTRIEWNIEKVRYQLHWLLWNVGNFFIHWLNSNWSDAKVTFIIYLRWLVLYI
jgi:hypothetical protein